MNLAITISKQAARRYPQMDCLASVVVKPLPIQGTSAAVTFSAYYAVNANTMVGPVTPQPVIR